MKPKKIKLNEKEKQKLIEELISLTKKQELAFRESIEKKDIDPNSLVVVNLAQHLVRYIPEVMEELFDKYGFERVVTDKNEIMNEGLEEVRKRFLKDLESNEVEEWTIYYILYDCKIPKEIKLSKDISIFAFGGRSGLEYLEIVERVINSFIGYQISKNPYEEIFQKEHTKRNPVAILRMEHIKAKSYTEVIEKTQNIAENITLSLSFFTSSYVDMRGCVISGRIGKFHTIFQHMIIPHYSPPFFQKETLEIGINKILNEIPENILVKLILKSQKEAIYEDDDSEFGVLKRWSLIEFLAEKFPFKESKIFNNEEIEEIIRFVISKNKSNSKIIDERIINCINNMNVRAAKEKVKTFLVELHCPIKKIDNSEKDIIDISYQIRNCIAHSGGCYKRDRKIKMKNCPTFCRDSKLDLKELNMELTQIIRHILGVFIGVQFGYEDEVPEHIKKNYENS